MSKINIRTLLVSLAMIALFCVGMSACKEDIYEPEITETVTVGAEGGLQMHTITQGTVRQVQTLTLRDSKGNNVKDDIFDLNFDNNEILQVEMAWLKAQHLPMTKEVSLELQPNTTGKKRTLTLIVAYAQFPQHGICPEPRVIRIVQNP